MARLEAENRRLRERARRCTLRAWRERQRVREVERRLEYLEALHSRIMATLRSPTLNPSERLVAVAAALEVAHQAARDERPADAPTRVSIGLLAEQAGVSRFTAGSALKRLAALGLIERAEERGRTPAGETRTEVHVRLPGGPLDTLWRAACFRPRNVGEARRHGGRRERTLRVAPCPEHPTAPITTACAICGRALQAAEAARPPAPASRGPEPLGPGGRGGGGCPSGAVSVLQHATAGRLNHSPGVEDINTAPLDGKLGPDLAGVDGAHRSRCGVCGVPSTLLILDPGGSARCGRCAGSGAERHDATRPTPPVDDGLPFEPPDPAGAADADDAASERWLIEDAPMLHLAPQPTADRTPVLTSSCPKCGGELARAPGFDNWGQCTSCLYAVWAGPPTPTPGGGGAP
jgi:DNA-binding transcriptional ArsR family regulator